MAEETNGIRVVGTTVLRPNLAGAFDFKSLEFELKQVRNELIETERKWSNRDLLFHRLADFFDAHGDAVAARAAFNLARRSEPVD